MLVFRPGFLSGKKSRKTRKTRFQVFTMYVKPNGLLSSSEKFTNGSWMQMGATEMIWHMNLFFKQETNGRELHIQHHSRFSNQN